MKTILNISVILLLFSTSCKKEVEFKGKDIQPKIVLNSVFYADSLIWCYVHKSNYVATGNFTITPLVNARVVLFDDAQPLDTLTHVGYGRFESSVRASTNKTYRLRASHANYPDAEGTSQTVTPSEIKSVEIIGTIPSSNGDQSMNLYRLRTSKNGNEAGYYRMRVFEHRYDYIYDQWNTIIDSMESFYPVYINMEYARGIEFEKYSEVFNGEYTNWQYTYYFTDKFVNAEGDGFIEFPIDQSSPWLYGNRLVFKVEKISKDFFLYQHTLSLLQSGDDFALFYQPVQTFMNIEGGLGIIGTSMVLPDYLFSEK